MSFLDRLFRSRVSGNPAEEAPEPTAAKAPPSDVAAKPRKGAFEILKAWGLTGYDMDYDADEPAPGSRVWFADGEEIAEAGAAAWIEGLRPYLATQGVRLDSVTDVDGSDGRVIAVNGRAVTLYDGNDADWYAASVRVARAVNGLLESAGSVERCYLLYAGGNEGLAAFIPQETYKRLVAATYLHPNDVPEDVGTLDAPRDQ